MFPGEFLGVSEEYVAGQGTFEEDGKIYAMFSGESRRDDKIRKVWVDARKIVRPLKEGDLVHGVIQQLYESMVMVKYASQPVGNEFPANGETAFLKISELMPGYVERLRDVVRVGDVVRARVHQVKPLATYLTMKDRDLGVVGASCSRCRSATEFDGKLFICKQCGSREYRKTPQQRGRDDGS